ncbi:MAG TPA: nitrous oxide reductase family maturation protein NosD [Burkholderiaceae bacterium]|nr:nitrous oxide reductase family maturation protein NosD [Burkholderiaceae bacterium]
MMGAERIRRWGWTLALLTGWLAACAPASGAVLRVAAGESIAAAIRAARPGDTIEVAGGKYTERLLIDKPLQLQGIGRPSISGADRGDVIRVRSAGVAIRGFVIRDSGSDLGAQNAGIYVEPGSDRFTLQDCTLTEVLFGIWLESSADAKIERNRITGKHRLQSAARGNGVQVFQTRNAQLIDNEISHTRDGFYVDVSQNAVFRGNKMHHLRYGTHYMNTHRSVWENNQTWLNRGGLALMMVRDVVVRNNLAWGNADHGIMLRTIQDSVIENNTVAGNGRGFFVYDAEYNTIQGNLVVDNQTGLHLAAGSRHNQVDGNDFIANREQVKYVASADVLWGTQQGNYWSNYSGWDQNGDGVGDLPYEANDVVDRLTWEYPLVKLLLSSPAVQTLRFVARQFPLLRAPSVVDQHPRMRPEHQNWRQWLGKQRN